MDASHKSRKPIVATGAPRCHCTEIFPTIWEREEAYGEKKNTLQFVRKEMMRFKDHESKLDMFTQDSYIHIQLIVYVNKLA